MFFSFHPLISSFFVQLYLSLRIFISNMICFFWKLKCNITCFLKGKDPISPVTCLDSCFSDFLNLPAEFAFWPLFIFFTISKVLGLCFKWGWSCWKAKIRGYKSHEGRRPQFCPKTLEISPQRIRPTAL